LTGANLVKNKIPIDLPRHFIRRALLVREGVARRRHPDGFLSSIEFLMQNPSERISQSLSVRAQLIDEFSRLVRFVAALN
jgi:hypothetical protein